MNKAKKKRCRNLERWNKAKAIVMRKLAEMQKLYPAPYEVVDEKTLVVRNVKQCDLCGGSVDRYCSTYPNKHFHYSTIDFRCTKCPAVGDPFMGVMTRLDMEYYEEMFAEKAA